MLIQNLKLELKAIKENTQKSPNSNDDKLEKMTKNMFLMGKVVDHLVEENRNYKKRKEDKKKKKETEDNKKAFEKDLEKPIQEPVKEEIKEPEKKVFNTAMNRKRNLKGML